MSEDQAGMYMSGGQTDRQTDRQTNRELTTDVTGVLILLVPSNQPLVQFCDVDYQFLSHTHTHTRAHTYTHAHTPTHTHTHRHTP